VGKKKDFAAHRRKLLSCRVKTIVTNSGVYSAPRRKKYFYAPTNKNCKVRSEELAQNRERTNVLFYFFLWLCSTKTRRGGGGGGGGAALFGASFTLNNLVSLM